MVSSQRRRCLQTANRLPSYNTSLTSSSSNASPSLMPTTIYNTSKVFFPYPANTVQLCLVRFLVV